MPDPIDVRVLRLEQWVVEFEKRFDRLSRRLALLDVALLDLDVVVRSLVVPAGTLTREKGGKK